MDYIELSVPVSDSAQAEIVTAMLSDLPFEAFEEQTGYLKAYIPADLYDEACRTAARQALAQVGVTDAGAKRIARSNWNAEWESDFEPVEVGGRHPVRIRAAHHVPAPEGVVDIVVAPHMSFGTGHHTTTSMMVRRVADMGVEGLRGLDMGCGTGILSVAALKFGAAAMTAVDIDEWAYANAQENMAANDIHNINVLIGDASLLDGGETYDIILANINRNILLNDMPRYAAVLRPGGRLVMSGFYTRDVPVLLEKASSLGLAIESRKEQDDWTAIVLAPAPR